MYLRFPMEDSGGVAWGDIVGTLSDQTDLQTALDAKQAKTLYAEFEFYGASGVGSDAGNKQRVFTTLQKNNGNGLMTLSQSATAGWSVTIVTPGLYSIYYNDSASSADNFGISINASDLTKAIYDLAATERLAQETSQTSNAQASMTRVTKLAANDVIRWVTEGHSGTPQARGAIVYLGAAA